MSAHTSAETAAVSAATSRIQRERNDGLCAAVLATQAVVEFDMEGKVLAANELFLKAVGYTLAEVQGQHHRMFCSPQYADSDDYRAFWAALCEGRHQAGEFLRLNRQGRPVWMQATYTPIAGADGQFMRVVKFASDITAAKVKALEDEGKVAAITRSQGTIEFDLAGNVLGANDNFLALTGYSRDEVVGQHHRLFGAA